MNVVKYSYWGLALVTMKTYTLIALLPIFLLSATTTTLEPISKSIPQTLEELIQKETIKRVQTIKIQETGSREDCAGIRGGSGEIGCWQILPSTFSALKKKHNIQVKGYSYEVQKLATIAEVKLDVIKGLTPAQTLKKWNSGNLRPCRQGINRWGIKYNSCKYVKEALTIYQSL